MALLAGQWTCDSQVMGSSAGWAPLQVTYTCVCLSPSSIIWYRPRGVISLAGKVTTGLVESNVSLPPGLWLMSPVGWLPRNRDQLPCPTLVIDYGTTSLVSIIQSINALNDVKERLTREQTVLQRTLSPTSHPASFYTHTHTYTHASVQ